MSLGRCVLLVAVLVSCGSCGSRRTTTSLPPEPSRDRHFAQEIRLTAGGETATGKITGLRGDTIVFLPFPYWGEEARRYALDAVTAVEVRRKGWSESGFIYGFAAGFATVGALAASAAEYDEDYTGGILGAATVGLLTGGVGAILGSGDRVTIYDLPSMDGEERHELARRLMASDAADPRTEERP